MDAQERLGHLRVDELAPLVAGLLDDPTARPETWQVEQLGWAAKNPGTVALHRVRCVASNRDGRRLPFTLVVKTVADPGSDGLPAIGYIHDPQDWNYWKREPLSFTSGLLDGYAGPFRPVRCFRVDDHGAVAVMWLEELHDDAAAGGWTPRRLMLAAEHLGRFNGDHLEAAHSAVLRPWLCRRFTHGWVRSIGEFGATAACESEDLWRHPALCGALGRSTHRRVAEVLADAEALLSLGDGLRLALAHHDAHRDNMFCCVSDDGSPVTAVLDWGFLGLAPLGEDLGHQIAMNLYFQHVPARSATDYERGAAAAYLRGLSRVGVDVDPKLVRAHAWAVAALRSVSFAAAQVAWLSEEAKESTDVPAWPTAWAEARGVTATELMSLWAATLDWLLQRADEARRFADAR